jgi:gamma-glutamyltranspeptidase/glutathione hydrolase
MKPLLLPAASLIVVVICLAQAPPTMFPPVRGLREMVGAANNFEVEAGYRMLGEGGNAVDAGVASVLAATVTEQSRVGLGGEIPILIKMAGRPVMAISGVGIAPAKATVDYYQHRKPEPWEDAGQLAPIPLQGIRSAITPGMFDGLIVALQQFGTKSFAEVAEPAIGYATQGFVMPDEFGKMLRSYRDIIHLWPDSGNFFYPGGVVTKPGEQFREPALAKTLRELVAAEKKARGNRVAKLSAVRNLFYEGSLAHRIADFNEKNGGLIAYEDMAKTKAEVEPAVTGTYRGYEIHKPGFWSQGPVMIEALNILEGFDLKSMGQNSPEYLHTVVEAVKLAFADRDNYYGDPKFSKIAEETLLSKDYATERRKLIDPRHASMEWRPGEIGPHVAPSTSSQTAKEPVNDTTCVDVFDSMGNAFSATPSGAWLPSVIAGDTGIPLTTRLQSFVLTQGHPNQLLPGKRPRVTLSPTIVTQTGQFVMELSTPGGDNQDQALLQVMLNVIEFGMGAQQAVEAPRFQTEHFYSSFGNHEFVPGRLSLENRIPKSTIDALAELGHQVNVTGEWSNTSSPVLIVRKNEVLDGGADIRRARFIFGR